MKRLFRFPWRSTRDIESEVDAELRFHLDERTAALVARGVGPDAARAQALREFGDVADARRDITQLDSQTEATRRRRDYMDELRQDLTYAIRKLRASPTFAITAILTLSIGIGANTAVFNLVNAALVEPPPVHDVSTLAWVLPRNQRGRFENWSLPDLADYREASKSWSGIAGFSGIDVTLGGDEPTHVTGQIVSSSYFDVLGVQPRPGHGFVPRDDSVSAAGTPVVLGYALWIRRFAADSAIVGKVIKVNGASMTIIGVAPEGFNGMRVGDEVSLWVPLAALDAVWGARASDMRSRTSAWFLGLGRLAPGATRAAAEREGARIMAGLDAVAHDTSSHHTLAAESAVSRIDPHARAKVAPVLGLLMVVPLLVLGVACANVANLFVARSVQREREVAVRRALGASRGRIVRQLLTECVVLGAAAAAVGMAMSWALTKIIIQVAALPPDVVALLHPDARVMAVTLVLALTSGALFGLLPSLAATRSELVASLKSEGLTRGASRSRHRLRNVFVVSQVALSLSLLITAGLFVGGVQRALASEPGFDPRNAVSAWYDAEQQGYDSTRVRVFTRELLDRLASDPDVASATLAQPLPLNRTTYGTDVRREGEPRTSRATSTYMSTVTPGYFTAMGVALVRGRAFEERDRAGAQRVAVVNERFAEVLWPHEEPLGKRFVPGGEHAVALEVVGVARNGRYHSLTEVDPVPFFWVTEGQAGGLGRAQVMVRSKTSTAAAMRSATRAMAAVAPNVPLFRANTLQDGIEQTIDAQRAGGAMLGISGALALGLAALGIFGVIAHGVAARTREIGIRMSLGARGAAVVGQFVREGLGLTMVGAGIGVVLSLAIARVISSLIIGLSATDAMTFVGAVAVLAGVALIASFVPARRAARVSPVVALKSD